jgi:hypothetical protein
MARIDELGLMAQVERIAGIAPVKAVEGASKA